MKMTENPGRKAPKSRRPAPGPCVSPLPPGINADAIGNAQIDDAYLASEEYGANRRAAEIEMEERRARVIALRRTGAPFRAIAEQLGVGVATVYDDYRKALDKLVPVEDLEAARQMELDRLDRLQMAHWAAATDSNHPDTYAAVNAVLKVMDRRAKLLGLDQPVDRTASDLSGISDLETIDQKIAELVDEMNRRDQWLGN